MKHVNMKHPYNFIYKMDKEMVQDYFFDKNHFKTKVCNSLNALFFWLLAITPFIAITKILFIDHNYKMIQEYDFYLKFFGLWGLFFLIAIPLLIICTNRRIKVIYHRRMTFNPRRVQHRKRWLQQYYLHKFGPKLHSIDNYKVRKNNNISVDYIERTYRKQLKNGKRVNKIRC